MTFKKLPVYCKSTFAMNPMCQAFSTPDQLIQVSAEIAQASGSTF